MAHYYTPNGQRFAPIKKDGTPYKVISKKLAREHGAVLGVTDILSMSGDRGWMKGYFSDLAIEAAKEVLAHPECSTDPEEFANVVRRKFNELADQPADDGTAYHDLLSRAVMRIKNNEEPTDEEAPAVDIVRGVFNSLGIKTVVAVEMPFYTDRNGICYGGTVDLFANGEDGRMILVDWKTTKREREPRPEEAAQIAAYLAPHMVGMTENDILHTCPRVADVYVRQDMFNNGFKAAYLIEIWKGYEISAGYDLFRSAYDLMMKRNALLELM